MELPENKLARLYLISSYILGFNEECQQLYINYMETNSNNYAKKLIQALNNQYRKKWLNLVEHTSFKYTTRKTWAFLRKLGGNSKRNIKKENQVNLNLIFTVL